MTDDYEHLLSLEMRIADLEVALNKIQTISRKWVFGACTSNEALSQISAITGDGLNTDPFGVKSND